MKRLFHNLFWVLMAVQCLSGFQMFKHWNSNVLIPFIFLSAFGAWLFKRSQALLIALLIVIITIAIYEVNAKHIIYYADKATGPLLILIIIFLVSHLREKYEGIREMNRELDAMVKERDQELTFLTDELLENAEQRRMALGQELHDGIGQQLTGIKLLCSSLDNQLQSEKKKESDLLGDLSSRAFNVHNDIRIIARALFPVRIAHVGLYSALNEMMSCYSELHKKHMQVNEVSEFKGLPESLALQLYRICQECCTFLLDHDQASSIEITLRTSVSKYIIAIAHDGNNYEEKDAESIFNLIRYRILKIKGEVRHSTSLISGQSIIYFEIPKPTH